ncbi:hypothetical protein EG68_03577 [Paragonimus skrjabini miyazakii]|uniref:Uncharacterized protein n=1 Tax=Paragonimus skrjabini miyazakii TaxID=59628 RepID=A0A8S9YY39_9TREM|nr:hypothetical protein EG68_03577 [Paragonimus skrjabini miyazakii]
MRVYNSSHTQLWPILCRVIKPFLSVPFVVGVYRGPVKPSDVQAYLRQCIDELDVLYRDGLVIPGSTSCIFVVLSSVVCDISTRCFVKQCRDHAGYSGCDHCSQRGVMLARRVTFRKCGCPNRTDESFRSQSDVHHHTGDSPFLSLPLDMIRSFPHHCMHLVCLSVTRRLIGLWLSSPRDAGHHLSPASIRAICDRINKAHACTPVDFQRLCRPLTEFERWKATEFRQFLLYLGPVVLHGLLESDKYKHFLQLFVCIYIRCHPLPIPSYAFKLEQNLLEESNSAQTDATERMTHFGARWPTRKRMPVRLTSSEDEQDECYQVHVSGSTHERSFSVSECAVPIPQEPVLKRMVSTPMTSPKQVTLAQPSPIMSCSGTQAANNEAAWLASIDRIAGRIHYYFKNTPLGTVAALEKRLIHVEAALNALTDKIQSTCVEYVGRNYKSANKILFEDRLSI